jgi:hypothetical protein
VSSPLPLEWLGVLDVASLPNRARQSLLRLTERQLVSASMNPTSPKTYQYEHKTTFLCCTTFAVRSLGGTRFRRREPTRTVEPRSARETSTLSAGTGTRGDEIGDFLVFEANPLQKVFWEVPLVTGGTAIQLIYSNRVKRPAKIGRSDRYSIPQIDTSKVL